MAALFRMTGTLGVWSSSARLWPDLAKHSFCQIWPQAAENAPRTRSDVRPPPINGEQGGKRTQTLNSPVNCDSGSQRIGSFLGAFEASKNGARRDESDAERHAELTGWCVKKPVQATTRHGDAEERDDGAKGEAGAEQEAASSHR